MYCGIDPFDLQRRIVIPGWRKLYPEGWLLPTLLVRDVTGETPCFVIKRECFDKVGFFDVNLPARQDWDMWIRLSTAYKIVAVHEVLVYAGQHSGPRIRSNAQNAIDAQWRIFEKYAPLRRQFPLLVRREAEGALFRRLGHIYLHYGISRRKALIMYLRSIIAWPFCFDTYAAFFGFFLPRNLRQMLHVFWNKVFGNTPLAIKSF